MPGRTYWRWLPRRFETLFLEIEPEGELFLHQSAIFVSVSSTGSFTPGKSVAARCPSLALPDCNGTYSEVLSVTDNDSACETGGTPGDMGQWTKCCNNTGTNTNCKYTVTFTGDPPPSEPKVITIDCDTGNGGEGGEGCISFNPMTQVAHVKGAESGC